MPFVPIVIVAGMYVLAPLAWLGARRWGRSIGYVLAAAHAGGALLLGAAAALHGLPIVSRTPWMESFGVSITLVVDALALAFLLVVLVIGALVMAYSARYLSEGKGAPRLFSWLTLFAGSMLGLVSAGDAILLFVFWELTSIASFFLIAGSGGTNRGPAMRALLVTAAGGLALFAALVLLATVVGSFDVGVIVGSADAVRAHATFPAIMLLLLAGAFTKSAQVPFHFWLPGAMVAPTPVSTYLHAATMVKAGVYLLARTSPLFAGTAWGVTVLMVGLMTALVGAVLALKQHDLKALLAYSTISQLGLLTALIGVGRFAALAVAVAHMWAHALYKASLFMVVGVIEKEAGSRDIRHLSGLRKAMPITAAVAGGAALSMAGIPPFLGFVTKEEAFAAFVSGSPGLVAALSVSGAVVASMMTFAYGARIVHGAFAGPLTQSLYEPARPFVAPAALASAGGLLLGAGVAALRPIAGAAAEAALRVPGNSDLALWHGFTMALALSAATVMGGLALFLARSAVDRFLLNARLGTDGTVVFERIYSNIVKAGSLVGAPFTSGVPARHIAWIVGVAVTLGAIAWAGGAAAMAGSAPPSPPADWLVVAFLSATAIGLCRSSNRMAAIALLGVLGFLVAVIYLLLGAPDLVLTQLLIETITVVIVVLVFRRLPRTFAAAPRRRTGAALLAAAAAGVFAAAGTYAFTGRREISEMGEYFLRAAPEAAGGTNVVNTILVDFRALDTLGEIAVLAIAALGVWVLVRPSGRKQ